jgi:(4-(4-[2-(gamma-L-glutamylamino)ethyl]phenoxymethyl)furan-2-yl)methanamine synthase
MGHYFGWDIGGVHLKRAKLTAGRDGASIDIRLQPFEIWKDPSSLSQRLRSLLDGSAGEHAVTMTAELSDVFASRAEGVRIILRACADAIPGPFRVFDRSGAFVSLDEAFVRPLEVAAANWMATARLVAGARRDALLIDVGSTTTDIIPIRAGGPRPAGRSDTERLVSGELVYSGVLRTPPSSLAEAVPLDGAWCRVSSEHFAIMADVYTILGALAEGDYTVPTPDGRGRGRDDAMARLARLVCGEAATIGPAAIETIARFLHERQIARTSEAILQVLSRPTWTRPPVAVTAGAGAFLAEAAARRAGLESTALAALAPRLSGESWPKAAPAAAIAVLLAEEKEELRFTT